MKLKAADFVYLKDLGVYPINRLVILRRYREGTIVPTNLNNWPKMPENAKKPISTVIGWVKDGDEKLFNLSFNEKWITETKMVHEILGEVLSNEFDFDAGKSIPIPGWSQGLLFGFLKAMGMTERNKEEGGKSSGGFDSQEIPFGNPNVLQEGATRDANSFGLVSNLDISLETSYEQKYINNIDPGIAMNDIIDNLLKMGTSDVRYVLSNSNSSVIKKLLAATNSGSVDAWLGFIKTLVVAFVDAIIEIVGKVASSFTGDDTVTEENEDTNEEVNLTVDQVLENTVEDSALKAKDTVTNINANGLLGSLLASTLNKYKWPLRGSVSVMTGLPSTPWHITVGNPYMPILSINNIVVDKVNIDFANQLSFNDSPINIGVKIDCRLGRNMGAQEIMTYFNNGYKRIYKVGSIVGDVTNPSNVAAGVAAGVGTGAVAGAVGESGSETWQVDFNTNPQKTDEFTKKYLP